MSDMLQQSARLAELLYLGEGRPSIVGRTICFASVCYFFIIFYNQTNPGQTRAAATR